MGGSTPKNAYKLAKSWKNMADETDEDLEGLNEEEDTSEKTETGEGETSEKDESQSQEKEPNWKAKANAIYAKLKEEKARRQELEAALAEHEKTEKAEKKTAEPKTEDEWRQKVEFLMSHKDFSEEEFNHVATVAKEFNVSLDEAAELEDDYIHYRREKVAKEKKIPEPGSASKESKNLSPEDIAKMSEEEHRKLFEEDLKNRGIEGGV